MQWKKNSRLFQIENWKTGISISDQAKYPIFWYTVNIFFIISWCALLSSSNITSQKELSSYYSGTFLFKSTENHQCFFSTVAAQRIKRNQVQWRDSTASIYRKEAVAPVGSPCGSADPYRSIKEGSQRRSFPGLVYTGLASSLQPTSTTTHTRTRTSGIPVGLEQHRDPQSWVINSERLQSTVEVTVSPPYLCIITFNGSHLFF